MQQKLIIILSVLFLLMNCSSDEVTINNEDLIFTNSLRIKIPPYNYSDSLGSGYEILGDTGYYSSYVDTVDNMPVFKWDSLGLNLITVVVASSELIVRNNEILNVEDIIWQWHSGMEFCGTEGCVSFLQGRSVENGIIDYSADPEPLGRNSVRDYHWAIWAWNISGTKVLYSSRQLEFHVIN
ncbi:MAG: hypothetical protein JW894_09900 [Bacteroidales bacterium]|nr:hypothetical protein [Bacteroidales bacterium]